MSLRKTSKMTTIQWRKPWDILKRTNIRPGKSMSDNNTTLFSLQDMFDLCKKNDHLPEEGQEFSDAVIDDMVELITNRATALMLLEGAAE